MKRNTIIGLIAFVLICAFAIVFLASQPRSLDAISRTEPSILCTVEQVADKSILVKVDPSDPVSKSNGSIWVSLNAEHPDSLNTFQVGDRIRIYFDGMIAETSPGQIHRVYAIVPA